MNSASFQRLRRIRQLALAHYVYPGALHTRFDHSIGTMHVAGRICERLREFEDINDDGIRIVRLAALLHDIGHGPFSHVSEFVLARHYDRERLGDVGQTEKIHERITSDIILQDREIGNVLGEGDRKAILDILAAGELRRFERDVVSGSLDADKMDYLLRDSYFAGVQYGQFDLNKIVDVCRVYKSGGETYLAFNYEGVYALEQLVMAKYHMGQQVYYHRVRAITDAMLVRGLTLAVEAEVEPVGKLFRYDGSPEFIREYQELYDDLVIYRLSESGHEKVSQLFSRLLNRRLFKQVSSVAVDEVENSIQRDRLSRLELESGLAKELEVAIADEIGCDSDFVIVTRQNIKNPTFRSPSYRLGEEEIMILDQAGVPHAIRDFPDLIFHLNTKAISKETIHVFAPRDDWGDPEDPRSEERRELELKIRETLLARVA